MVKGVSVKFVSYDVTVPKLLNLIKLHEELKKHEKIVLKVDLNENMALGSQKEFVESVLKFCVFHKSPGAEIVLAEGSDGINTMELFDLLGYRELAEKYGVGLVDLNHAEVSEEQHPTFLRFDTIKYPTMLKESFVITLPFLHNDEELKLAGSLSSMRSAFPAKHYKSFFSKRKNKLDAIPPKYQVHDIIQCKLPDLALIDASEHNVILAGQPLPMDKQAAKYLGLEWRDVEYLNLLDNTLGEGSEKPINSE